MTKKKRRPRRPRDLVTLSMLLGRKGGPMRDRRLRRPDDARRAPKDDD